MTTKQRLAAATKGAVAHVRVAGIEARKQLIEAADAALVAQGKAARARQRKRARKAALKTAGKTLAIAGAATAAVMAARAATRAVRRSAAVST